MEVTYVYWKQPVDDYFFEISKKLIGPFTSFEKHKEKDKGRNIIIRFFKRKKDYKENRKIENAINYIRPFIFF